MRPALALVVLCAACDSPPPPSPVLLPPGGRGTIVDVSEEAFGRPFPGLSRDEERRFFRGRALFRDVWVSAPASATSRDGLGPLFHARACEPCHQRDGRGAPPLPGQPLRTMLLRLSVPNEHGAPVPHPVYGGQWQPLALDGVPPEGEATVSYRARAGKYEDGQPFELLHPSYRVDTSAYGPLGDDVQMSPRVAPAMHGLGLLAAIPEAALLEHSDPDDRDGDGISGRENRVFDVEAAAFVLGRFGWKANQPSLRQQVAGAFLGDIGMTSSLFPKNDCTAFEEACIAQANGGEPELTPEILDDVTFYSGTLAVPARRALDRETHARGEQLFVESRCDGCHTPEFELPSGAPGLGAEPDRIRPFTDLLLHDMGPALADERPDFAANGREWRTPPLWGLGLISTVNGHGRLLHDGRARDVAEAILFHGGEAAAAADAFMKMSRSDRDALIAFVLSL